MIRISFMKKWRMTLSSSRPRRLHGSSYEFQRCGAYGMPTKGTSEAPDDLGEYVSKRYWVAMSYTRGSKYRFVWPWPVYRGPATDALKSVSRLWSWKPQLRIRTHRAMSMIKKSFCGKAIPSTYTARKIDGCAAHENSALYSGTTLSSTDPMCTHLTPAARMRRYAAR